MPVFGKTMPDSKKKQVIRALKRPGLVQPGNDASSRYLPHQAPDEAISIAKERGIIQLTMSGPERIFNIAIVSKIPYTFALVMFAPEILDTFQDLAEYYEKEIARLLLIARDAAATAELWIRSRHGKYLFLLVTPNPMVEIDREGKRLGLGETIGEVYRRLENRSISGAALFNRTRHHSVP